MKKIGIISYFNYYNYGSMLQGFALQKYIIDVYPDCYCEIINYRNHSVGRKSFISLLKIRFKRLFFYISNLREINRKRMYANYFTRRNSYFDAFLKDYACVTPVFYRTKQQLLDNPPIYDIYITGSDQTWSPKASGGYDESPMFLDFAPLESKKAAYAPCLGVNSFTTEQIYFLKSKLSNYSLISCREVIGARLLSDIINKHVPAVVDPTLLLSASQWRSIKINPIRNIKYIFCYFLGDRQYYRDFAFQLSKQTGLPLYYLPVCWKEFCSESNYIWDAGPQEFVGLIDDAEYVLTDSFHGVVFSTNLNKNFYAFVKHSGSASAGDNSRIFDYLERIGLSHRLYTEYDNNNILIENIDYNIVNDKLYQERQISYNYLDKIIKL